MGWLDDAEARAEKATEGPWELAENAWRIEYGERRWEPDPVPGDEAGSEDGYWYRSAILDDAFGPSMDEADWAFIAAARTDLPRALALCRELGEALAEFMPVAGRWLEATDDEQPTDLVLAENRAWNHCAEALAAYKESIGE